MQVSLVIPCLNSYEVVRRQVLHFERMNLPDDVEIIIMDDGSDPPIEVESDVVTVHQTNETRPWTSSIARNRGAKIAKGRNLIMIDLDYIVPKEVIMEVRDFTGQKMHFKRAFGVLDEDGNFTQDRDALLDYGLLPARYKRRGAGLPPHPNVYAMNRDIFFELGGYNESLVLRRQYPQGEDNLWKHVWQNWVKDGKGEADPHSPMIYMFPCGQFCGDVDYNPHDLFHSLTRKTKTNVFWQRQLRGQTR